MSENIFQRLIRNEDSMTELLCGLLSYKPIRDIVIKLFTFEKLSAYDVTYEDVDTQKIINGVRPDILIEIDNKICIVVENKIYPWTPLTKNQPKEYLSYILNGNFSHGYLVLLTPSCYYNIKEIKNRIENFIDKNEKCHITEKSETKFEILNTKSNNKLICCFLTWEDIINKINLSELSKLNNYIDDFLKLLCSYFAKIELTCSEVAKMYDKNTAEGLPKILKLIEGVTQFLQSKYEDSIYVEQKKRWWETEFGCYVRYNGKDILWFGLWMNYWKEHGVPLCYGVSNSYPASVVNIFRKIVPDYVSYTDNPNVMWYISNVDKKILVENAKDDLIKLIDEMTQKLIAAF